MIKWINSFFILCVFLFHSSVFAAKAPIELPKKESVEAAVDQEPQLPAEKKDYLRSLNTKVFEAGEESEIAVDLSEEERDESEIPVAMGTKEKASSAQKMKPFHKMLAALATFLLFALILFYFIHKSSKRGALASGARNIKILSQKSIGPKRELMVIKVAGESVLLGVTDHNVNFIKNLSILDDEMPDISPESFPNELHRNLVPGTSAQRSEDTEKVDGFAVSKLSEVQDAVTRRYL